MASVTAVEGQPVPGMSKPTTKVSEQLADRLRDEIANGVYRPGQLLPPEAASGGDGPDLAELGRAPDRVR